jgi:hypothetical protein
MIDERIKEWASPAQCESIDAVNQYGGVTAAAKATGKSKGTISQNIKRAKERAARNRYAPEAGWDDPTPPGFMLDKVSQYDAKKRTWFKMSADKERQRELLEQWVETMPADIPRLPPIEPPKQLNSNLMNVHIITDLHLNMLVHKEDAGADWNLEVAEEVLIKCFSAMLVNGQNAETGVIANIGDFYHFDGVVNQTSRSQHPLTSAASYSAMIEVGQRLERRMIDMALHKYNKVHVIRLPGNHDEATILATTPLFAALYENEPRVSFDLTRRPHKVLQFGKTMIGFTHGDRVKLTGMPGLFASKFGKMWGETEYRYSHKGHLHHDEEKYIDGMLCSQHATLSPTTEREEFHGYGGPRHAKTITYHREFGHRGSATTSPEMVA